MGTLSARGPVTLRHGARRAGVPRRRRSAIRLWTGLWSTRWRNPCRGGQPGVNCGWLVDGQRILKLLLETSCAARTIGVEISLPPGTVVGEGETPSHPARGKPPAIGAEETLRSAVRGQPRATGGRADSAPPGKGNSGPLAREARSHRQGMTSGLRARGHPGHPATGATPEPPVRSDLGPSGTTTLRATRRGGKSWVFDLGRTPKPPAQEQFRVSDLGRHPEPPGEEELRTVGEGQPGLSGKGKLRPTGEEALSRCRGGDPGVSGKETSEPPG